MAVYIHRVGHNHIYIYTRCIYGIFGREFTKYTVIYNVYARFWPTLYVYGVYAVLGNPTNDASSA
jgi:hypothetical protein